MPNFHKNTIKHIEELKKRDSSNFVDPAIQREFLREQTNKYYSKCSSCGMSYIPDEGHRCKKRK